MNRRSPADTDGPANPVRVLSSFPAPRPTTNPYIHMLAASLRATPGLQLSTFSWRSALLGRYDVFHAHWPEILPSGRTPARRRAREAMFAALLVRLVCSRAAVVRTVHNVDPPAGLTRVQYILLRTFDRITTVRIVLTDATATGPGQARVLIPHGHYREWFAAYPRTAGEAGTVSFFGLIRRYKGVEDLVAAFRSLPSTSAAARLRIAGKPSTDELRDQLRSGADGDDRVHFRFEFLDDADLATEIGTAELVVLPYPLMHNSGGVLTALSFDRPVLVVDNAANRMLQSEVGAEWLHLYTAPLSGADIEQALIASRRRTSEAVDLSARDWARAGTDHLAAYRRALELVAARRGPVVTRLRRAGRR